METSRAKLPEIVRTQSSLQRSDENIIIHAMGENTVTLLTLPLELRCEIYKVLSTQRLPVKKLLQLLLTCRQVYKEAHLLAFSLVTFRLSHWLIETSIKNLDVLMEDSLCAFRALYIDDLALLNYDAKGRVLDLCRRLPKLERLQLSQAHGFLLRDTKIQLLRLIPLLQTLLASAKTLRLIKVSYQPVYGMEIPWAQIISTARGAEAEAHAWTFSLRETRTEVEDQAGDYVNLADGPIECYGRKTTITLAVCRCGVE